MDGFNINGKIVIGIDHGYGNMKTRHFVFKSGVKAYDYMPPLADTVLEFEGKYYVIGEAHKVFIANKDEDDDYYILTLAAIAKELEIRGLSQSDKMYTDQLGVHQCMKKIKNELQAKCSKLPDNVLIEEFLRNGVTDLPESMLMVMQNVAGEYVASIFEKLSEYEYDPDLVKLHIIGGGGSMTG